MLYFFSFEIRDKNLMIKIVERDNIIIKQVIHNNKFDINNVVPICQSDAIV